MNIGLHFTPTAYAMDPVELAITAEGLGFESIMLPEHTHVPVRRETPYVRGGDLPREYLHMYSQMVTLTMIAARTDTLRVATGACLVTEHDPIVMAKDVATLDQFSNGRVILGVGAGWSREEMRNHGTDPTQRWQVLRERIQLMQSIWTQDEASYEGEHVKVEPLWSWPKPTQRPYPPVLIGGHPKRVLPYVAEYADGWLPQQVGEREFDDLERRILEMQRLAGEHGRGPLQVTVNDPLTPAPTAEDLARYEEIGVSRCVLRLPCADRSEVLPVLEQHAAMISAAGHTAF